MSGNGSITLPAGASNHGDPNLLCLPAKWTDVVVFFLGNYVAHAATVRTSPGSSKCETIYAVVAALVFPISGINRGLNAITSFANFAKTDLETAARAGALCKVIRLDEQSRTLGETKLAVDSSWRSGKVHGRLHLPEGYGLAIVHRDAKFEHNDDTSIPIVLSSDYNAISILVAMGQLLFAIATIYRTRGDQITRYGYAAFGLTVTQYALMSLVNLIGNLICPNYPTLYLVESEEVLEALTYPDTIFEGYVGKLIDDCSQKKENLRRQAARTPTIQHRLMAMRVWRLPLVLIPTAISVGIIAALTHFRHGSSTYAQRVWTMTWLAVGSYVGALPSEMLQSQRKGSPNARCPMIFFNTFYYLLMLGCVVPAVGGLIVVGQMLSEYGTCSLTT